MLGEDKNQLALNMDPDSGRQKNIDNLKALKRIPIYPTRSFWIYLSFLAFVVARYVQLGARRDILATVRFEFLLGIVVIALVGSQIASRKPEIGNSQPVLIAIAALFFAMIIQLPLAADPRMARTIFMDRVVKFAILTFLMVGTIESPKYLKLFLMAFLFSVFYITLESVRGLISGGLYWENQGIMRLHGAVPIYQHANSLGGVAMGALPFIIFLFPQKIKWIWKIGLIALACTSLVCVIYSGSRTAYLGLLSLVLWWWFISENRGKFFVYLVIVGAIALAFIPDQYIERFQSIGGEEKEGHSTEARIVILKDAMNIFVENPIGIGVASFQAVRMAKYGRSQDTHNLYLEVATNLGIQGLIVFLGLVLVIMAAYRRTAISFEKQSAVLIPILRDIDLPLAFRKKAVAHYNDLKFMKAVAQAAGGFIFVRLVLGVFGMDLYEVYWWFGSGLAIGLSGLVETASYNTRFLVSGWSNLKK